MLRRPRVSVVFSFAETGLSNAAENTTGTLGLLCVHYIITSLHRSAKAPVKPVIFSFAIDKLVKSCGKYHQFHGLCAIGLQEKYGEKEKYYQEVYL